MESVTLLVVAGVIEVLRLATAQGLGVWTEWVRTNALRTLVRDAGPNAAIIVVVDARRVDREGTGR